MRPIGKRGKFTRRKGMAGIVLCVFLAATSFAACGGDAVGPEGQGRMTVLLTDAPFPFDLVSEANVTIERVDVVGEFGVETIAEGEQHFNLLDLQSGVTAALASSTLPAGPVVQIRLIVTEASVVLLDGTTFDLLVPSGAQTGIKILTPGVEVAAGAETTTTLDMDVSESFIVQGNAETMAGIQGFIFTPVVHVAGTEMAGAEAEEGTEEEFGESDSGEGL